MVRVTHTPQNETSPYLSTVIVEERKRCEVKHPLTRNISTFTGKHIFFLSYILLIVHGERKERLTHACLQV